MKRTSTKISYLSDEWLTEANRAVETLAPISSELSVGFVITDSKLSYAVDFGPTQVRFHRDLETTPVQLNLTHTTAAAIASGQMSAQRAFLDGELRVSGDVRELMGNEQAIKDLADCLAELRERTDFS